MRRDVAAGVVLAIAAVGVLLWLMGGSDAPVVVPVRPVLPEPAEESRVDSRPAVAPSVPVPATPTEADLQMKAIEDPAWKRYPEDERGPVVVGVLVEFGSTDPPAWVALEDMEDPARTDPSTVVSLDWGRFRLTGMQPGRYRVRAKGDDSIAVYSEPIVCRDGEVADAGIMRLRSPGRIAGAVYGPDGEMVKASVSLVGRDPASLSETVLEQAESAVPQGFEMKPHETGDYSLAATGPAGYAVYRGSSDTDGLGWADIRLRPWASARATLLPRGGGEKTPAVGSVDFDFLDAVPTGLEAGPSGEEKGVHRGLMEGRWRVTVKWEERVGDEAEPKEWVTEAVFPSGEETVLEVPR